jgi:hypothetical protein
MALKEIEKTHHQSLQRSVRHNFLPLRSSIDFDSNLIDLIESNLYVSVGFLS